MAKVITQDMYKKYKDLTNFPTAIANVLAIESEIRAKINEAISAVKSKGSILVSNIVNFVEMQEGILMDIENGTMMIQNPGTEMRAESAFLIKMDKTRASINRIRRINIRNLIDLKKASELVKNKKFDDTIPVFNVILSSRKDNEKNIEDFKAGLRDIRTIL